MFFCLFFLSFLLVFLLYSPTVRAIFLIFKLFYRHSRTSFSPLNQTKKAPTWFFVTKSALFQLFLLCNFGAIPAYLSHVRTHRAIVVVSYVATTKLCICPSAVATCLSFALSCLFILPDYSSLFSFSLLKYSTPFLNMQGNFKKYFRFFSFFSWQNRNFMTNGCLKPPFFGLKSGRQIFSATHFLCF